MMSATQVVTNGCSSLSGESAFLHVTRKLWQRDSEKVELDICDHIIIEQDKSISLWLFSSKEGQVKSKKKENRADTGKVWDHLTRVKEFLDLANTGGDGSNAHNFRVQSLCYATDNNQSNKWEVADDPSIFSRNSRLLVVVPSTQMQGTRLLKVDYKREAENLIQPAKVKCYVPKLEKKHSKGKYKHFLPEDYQECHNALYTAVATNYVNRLARIIDGRSSSAVLSMTVYLCICEVEVEAHVPVNSPSRYRAWLYFVEELSQMQVKRQIPDSSASVSSKLTKRLDPELQSQASLIKPWAFCMGDFCFFDENGRRNGRRGDDDFGMDDDFDAITESKLAIKRHRPIPTGGHNDIEDLLGDDDGDENSEMNSPIGRARQGESFRPGIIPTKSRTIMVKSILLAREEMDVIQGLDHQFTGEMISKPNANPLNRMGFKSQVEQIWPLSIAKWWINIGQQEQPAVPKVGKIPDVLLKHIRSDTLDSASNLDAKERNKWFSWYYSQVKVCESCYFIYQELESFRQTKTKQLQRNARLESDEYKMTAEQKKEKDREIERRIFQQRKLMTRLSKCKSAPALGESDEVEPFSLRGQNSNAALPPLAPWKATTRFNAEALHKSSIAKHIMNKQIEFVRSNDSDDVDTLRRWEEVTNLPEKPKLPPVRVTKKPPKKTVSTDNYTANRLLHPWQRELGKLREQVANGVSPDEALRVGYSPDKQPLPNVAASRPLNIGRALGEEEEDEDDENDFGELGWSPFVI